MATSIFIPDGKISKESSTELQVDLINFRDNFFNPNEYFYNILRWKEIVLSYTCSGYKVSDQKFEIKFRMEQGNTTTAEASASLGEYFLGDLVLNQVRVYDKANGVHRIKAADALAIDNSFNIGINLPIRPESTIQSISNLENLHLLEEEIGNWQTGWKVQLTFQAGLSNIVYTIDSIDTNDNYLVLSPSPVPVASRIGLRSPDNTLWELLLTEDDVIETDDSTGISVETNIILKADNSDDLFSLVIDNEGILGIEYLQNGSQTDLYIENESLELRKLGISEDFQLYVYDPEFTLVGSILSFAKDDSLLTEDQLIDYTSF